MNKKSWYQIGLIARIRFSSAQSFIQSLTFAHVALTADAVRDIRRAFSDVNLLQVAQDYLETGVWTDENRRNCENHD